MNKAVFLDRDGVINDVVVEGNGLIRSPRTYAEFVLVEGVDAFLAALKVRGFKLVVVTNQPDIARGLLSLKECKLMNDALYRRPIDKVFCCPHDDSDFCACRKPRPGLILAAAKQLGIDLSQSFLLGDGKKDIIAALSAGCVSMLLYRSYNFNAVKYADVTVVNFKDALDFIDKGVIKGGVNAIH